MIFSKFNYIFLMIPFSTGTRLESVGSLGQTWIDAGLVCRLWTWLSSAKARKKGGSARALPVAAPMPNSVSF